jgi:5-methylthioadenosine/S-adenosylhomocysteine deaminase
MKIALGKPQVADLLNAGINVCLGTDGAAESNCLDLIEAMKFAALLQKYEKQDPTVLPASQALEMATINGAKALGVEDEIGSLESGKKADILIINLRKPSLMPISTGPYLNIVDQFVYSAARDCVETVIVDGKTIIEKQRLMTGDEDEIFDAASLASANLLKRRESVVENRDRSLDQEF